MLAAVAELPAAAPVGSELAVLEPAAAGVAGARLKPPQPEPLLELAAGVLGAWPVVVDARLAAVLGYERDDQGSPAKPPGCSAGGWRSATGAPPADQTTRTWAIAGNMHMCWS